MHTNFDILIFDISGKFAHFRKFYANSSSLSYLFPPRTTVEGIIAAILGCDRDSYYDIFDPSVCMIQVSPRTRMRSFMQTVNYLFVKSLGDLNGKQGRTQIPFEIVVPENFNERLRYRIYFSHSQDQILSRLELYLKNGRSHFPVSLGPASFLADFIFISRIHNATISLSNDEAPVKIRNPIPANKDLIASLLIDQNRSSKFTTDIFPFHFTNGRTPGPNLKLIYDRNFQPVFMSKPNIPITEIKYTDSGDQVIEDILFHEPLVED